MENDQNRSRMATAVAGRFFLLLTLGALSALAWGQSLNVDKILQMSPEQLSGLQVTSVSKKREPLAGVPASIFVITQEAIRRSGATSLTEALRLAPNLHVASDNGIPGYITARGHSGGYYTGPNMLLVLIDGRSVYSPLFSGVLWDAQDVVLEDIDRIEVISGPAGVLWGVNAVNGVINITTKPASRTRGQLVSINASGRGMDTSIRHGARLDNGGSYRVYGRYFERNNTTNKLTGLPIDDSWHRTLLGLRADWERQNQRFSWQANVYNGAEGQPLPGMIDLGAAGPLPQVTFSGLNTTARWTSATADGGSVAVQAYLDLTRRSMQPAVDDDNKIADLEFQHNLSSRGVHSITWGANYRHSLNNTSNGPIFGFVPARASQSWLSVFGQDEISLRPDLRLTIGARVERGPYATVDFLPSVRLAWQLHPRHLIWSGASRSARGPARFDVAARLPLTPPYLFGGNPDPRSEIVDAIELGYRTQGDRGSFSATLFRNFYDRISSIGTEDGGLNWYAGNSAKSYATGIEMWGDWRVRPGWTLSAGLTGLNEEYSNRYNLPAGFFPVLGGNNPAHTAQFRSSWDLGAGKELDLAIRRVASLSSLDVPSYNAIDARFGWQLNKNLALSLTGQNLLGTEHVEYGNPAFRATMPRQVFAKLVWRN